MRVYIGDLTYLHDWDHARPVPLNAGYVAAYLMNMVPDVSVKIFKDPRVLLDRVTSTQPSVLALSHYEWNANMDLFVMKRAKEIHPGLITVLGGPNFHANEPEWIEHFFRQRPHLDLYISGEGEWSFTRFIELLIHHGSDFHRIPHEEWPSTFFGFDRSRKSVIHNSDLPVSRLDLSEVPSPYLTGLMDPFLEDERLAPIIETNRGCPFSCAFCCWGNALQSKVRTFSLETVLQEIRYAAQRSRNPTKLFYVADGNFGILKRDLEIARVFHECADKYGSPRNLYVYFAKNTTDSIIKIATVIKNISLMSMSRQSLNEDVLENIGRKNISNDKYDILKDKCQKQEIKTFCELIYGLPGESFESFVDGVIASAKGGQRVTVYPHLMIAGAETATKHYREKFNIKSEFRINPRCTSSDDDIPTFECEEVVTETDNFTRNDFFRAQELHFMVSVLTHNAFSEFHRGLEICGLNYAALANFIVNDEANWGRKWRSLLKEFKKSCENQFLSEHKIKQMLIDKDMKNIGKYGVSLNALYMAKLVSDGSIITEFQEYLSQSLKRFLGRKANIKVLRDLNTRMNLSFDRLVCYENPTSEKIIEYDYDIEAWLDNTQQKPLVDFRLKKPARYRLFLADDVLPAFEHVSSVTNSVAEALYILRIHIFALNGDRVFSYGRERVS